MAHGQVNLVAIDRDMNIGHFNLVHETKKLPMTSVGRAGSRLRLAIFLVVFALSALAASHRGTSTPQEISARLKSGIDKWQKVIQKAGIQKQKPRC